MNAFQNKKINMTKPANADTALAIMTALATKEKEAQARISTAVKLAIESTQTTATLAERKRISAISKLSKPGFEAQVKAAIESGASAGDFSLAIMTKGAQ